MLTPTFPFARLSDLHPRSRHSNDHRCGWFGPGRHRGRSSHRRSRGRFRVGHCHSLHVGNRKCLSPARAGTALTLSVQCPKKVRGALVAGYQFCITIGILLASCINYATEKRTDSGSYRIPIGIQFAWGLILAGGLMFLPDSPRYYVKRGNIQAANDSLSRLRGQPAESEFVQSELSEIIANEEYERSVIPATGFVGSWLACFSGGLWNAKSNLRRTILGTSLQMMQQWFV